MANLLAAWERRGYTAMITQNGYTAMYIQNGSIDWLYSSDYSNGPWLYNGYANGYTEWLYSNGYTAMVIQNGYTDHCPTSLLNVWQMSMAMTFIQKNAARNE